MVQDKIIKGLNFKLFLFFLFLFIFFLSLPFLLGLSCKENIHPSYRVTWFNFLGAHYKLPIDTPKPLIVFLNAIVPQTFGYLFPSLFSALWVLSFMGLTKKISGVYLNGFFASILCIFCNREVFCDFFLTNYWPITYIPLLFFQILLFLKRRYAFCFCISLLTSLIRPESWFYTVFFIAYLYFKKEKIKPIYLLPFIAPVIWVLFDYRISGDFFFGYRITQSYYLVSASEFHSTSFLSYWSEVMKGMLSRYEPFLLALGIFAILVRKIKSHFLERIDILIILALFPFLAYWIFSLKEDIIVMNRFFSFSISVFILYATLLPCFLLKKFSYGKYLNLIYLLLLVSLSFNGNDLRRAVLKRKANMVIRSTAEEIGVFLKDNLNEVSFSKTIIVPERETSYFSLMIGEQNSWKLVSFREIFSNVYTKDLEGLAIYIDYHTWYYEFLRNISYLNIRGEKYILEPIYVTKNKVGTVYNIFKE
ncbi:MAG: hypothetical protein KKC11_05980 [Candidatus Omnitrophica bacterium]|nr:hypothetical protein [Candidatus Omnitrophota bacterium]MBU0878433.1 hypothetical protein [Candidatus Omnitrophota bacterium]MBU1133602.1 hypothetical protein [Candidatus Omnitrophota bacterium]MBU1366308.1 hypothetical protein [Candidatus Omnitrophota bacterium]MBU1523286.1 hypothetical protein [Candidatus Omnitrophota bacterium]